MKKWEYKFIESTTAGVNKSPEKVIEEMNTAGDEGYRLVQIDLPCTKSGVVMEREISDSPAEPQSMDFDGDSTPKNP